MYNYITMQHGAKHTKKKSQQKEPTSKNMTWFYVT